MRNSNAELAVQTCLEGIKQYPDDASILCLAGQSLIALKRFDAARGILTKQCLYTLIFLLHMKCSPI